MHALVDLARLIPTKVRFWIYTIVSSLVFLEAVFDVVHGGAQDVIDKAVAVLAGLGLAGAAANVNRPVPQLEPAPEVPPEFP